MSTVHDNRFYREVSTKPPHHGLSPCPFCGEDEALSLHSCGGHRVSCQICFMDGPTADTPEDALEAWNTRLEIAEVEREACIAILEDLRPKNDRGDWTEYAQGRDAVISRAIAAIVARYGA